MLIPPGTEEIDYSYSQESTYIEYDNQEDVSLKIGMRVNHEIFGKGVIKEIKRSGNSYKVTVHFDQAGRKKLHMGFTQLYPIM